MKVHILASGSAGNATCIEMGGSRFLLDAGISARRLKQGLSEVGILPDSIDGIFITHEHIDHIKGLATFTKKYRTPVFARRDTFLAMGCRMDIPQECIRVLPERMVWQDIEVSSFSTLHDAADPVGYTFTFGGEKLGLATDLGFVTERVKEELAGSDVLIFEANHDLDMLKSGPYPPMLKRRIMSSRGHLANDAAAWALAQILGEKQATVFLAHLSQENNEPRRAWDTVAAILDSQGLRHGREVDLRLTMPAETVSIERETEAEQSLFG